MALTRTAQPRVYDPQNVLVLAALLSLFTFVACYFRAFVFPDIPVLPRGDQLWFLFRGSRMASGELIYRDFFEIIPAATELLYAFFVKVFGLYNWIPGLVMAFLAGGVVVLTTLMAGRLMRGPVIALPGLLFAGFVLPGSFDATHHWFSTIAVLGAVLVLIDEVTPARIAAAGALCGVAASFTQSKGAAILVALMIYLAWKMGRERATSHRFWRNCLILCGAAAGVFLAVNGYFIGGAGVRRWFFCVVIYPMRYYSAPALNNWRVVKYEFQWHTGAWKWITFPFVYIAVPLAYALFFASAWRRWRTHRELPSDKAVLVALTGLAMLGAVALSPSIKRLSTVSPPALIILVWLIDRARHLTSSVKLGLALAAGLMMIAAPLHTQLRWRARLLLPGGETALLDPAEYTEYRWALTHTHPGQYFFGMPPLYVPFHMRNPTAVDAFDDSEYTRPEQVLAAVQQLERCHLPLMVLLPFKESRHSASDHTGAFREYMLRNYRITKTFPNGHQLWEETTHETVNHGFHASAGPGQ